MSQRLPAIYPQSGTGPTEKVLSKIYVDSNCNRVDGRKGRRTSGTLRDFGAKAEHPACSAALLPRAIFVFKLVNDPDGRDIALPI